MRTSKQQPVTIPGWGTCVAFWIDLDNIEAPELDMMPGAVVVRQGGEIARPWSINVKEYIVVTERADRIEVAPGKFAYLLAFSVQLPVKQPAPRPAPFTLGARIEVHIDNDLDDLFGGQTGVPSRAVKYTGWLCAAQVQGRGLIGLDLYNLRGYFDRRHP